MTQWLRTRYYPVDVSRRRIYDDPQATEGAASLAGKYRGHQTIGVKGARLSQYACYQEFTVVPPLYTGRYANKRCAVCGTIIGNIYDPESPELCPECEAKELARAAASCPYCSHFYDDGSCTGECEQKTNNEEQPILSK